MAPQEPVPAAAPAKKGHLVRNLGLGCGGLIVLIIVLMAVAAGGAKNTNNTGSQAAAPDNSSSSSTQSSTSAPSKAAPAPQTLLDVSGSGTKTTQKFTAGGDWDLVWSYDCSNFGQSGNFQVYVYDDSGSLSLDNSPVNQLGKSGNDVEHYHTGGRFYLTVNSECSWHVTVKG